MSRKPLSWWWCYLCRYPRRHYTARPDLAWHRHYIDYHYRKD